LSGRQTRRENQNPYVKSQSLMVGGGRESVNDFSPNHPIFTIL
jgi:hypothetical protein